MEFRGCVGKPAQRFVGLGAKVEVVDIVFRADYRDLGALQLDPEFVVSHAGVNVFRLNAVCFRQAGAQSFHRAVIADAVHGDHFLQIGRQSEILFGEAPHCPHCEVAQLVRASRLAMVLIHCHVHPNIVDLDVLEDFRIQTLDMVLVLMSRDKKVDALLVVAGVGQHLL